MAVLLFSVSIQPVPDLFTKQHRQLLPFFDFSKSEQA